VPVFQLPLLPIYSLYLASMRCTVPSYIASKIHHHPVWRVLQHYYTHTSKTILQSDPARKSKGQPILAVTVRDWLKVDSGLGASSRNQHPVFFNIRTREKVACMRIGKKLSTGNSHGSPSKEKICPLVHS
jgi:hypothetical protein